MKPEIDTVKGFQDFLPPISQKRNEIKKTIQKYFELYGFVPLETPIIEFDELIKGDSLPAEEDEAVSDRFRLKDRAGRNLGLRYEFTFQLQRLFKQNPNLKLPFKRYQIGPVFRDEPITSNRFRQFTQCDADIIGDPSINADAECLALASEILKSLNIDFEIEINNRALIQSLIESVQIQNPEAIMKELDKLDKIGEDQVKLNLKKYADSNQVLTLFKLLDKNLEFYLDNGFKGAEQIKELIEKCKAYKIQVKFNQYLARGLSYYTGSVFEFKTPQSKDSIGAGGRYDKVVGKLSNRDIPAVGFSFGLERLTQLANIPIKNKIKALLISFEEDKAMFNIAKKLRKAGVPCITTFGNPSKQLDYANSLEIPYVIFVGEQEIESQKFKLKDMSSGEEKLLTEKQLINKLT
ncbi:histidine--tRNA ligase [Candidatus Pacearchaeota archaeon]|nr:histidine--tRNA ligase [Candidatus Pacearchaeota archaeon]|tara:strand:- start:897 stop:2120 length:1224 start_codon:yes stop_codon:yes gene_type:complete